MAEMNQCFQNAKIYNETESMLYQVYDLSDWPTLWNAREKSIFNSKILNYNITIELTFAGINMFLARLRIILARA